MANTYSQIYIQFVFAVQGRANIISKKYQGQLNKYIIYIVQNNEHKLLEIGEMPDHIHVFVGRKTTQSISDLMKEELYRP